MGNQNEKFNTQPVETIMEIKPRRVWWKYAVGVSLIVFFIVGGYVVWYQYFSSEAKYSREVEKSALELPAKLEAYKKAREADIYGGKTPEETLQMFIEALENRDLELASKYFAIDNDSVERDSEHLENLKKAEKECRVPLIINAVSKAKYDQELKGASDNSVWFVVLEEGEPIADINLEFNQYSGVWKIESL